MCSIYFLVCYFRSFNWHATDISFLFQTPHTINPYLFLFHIWKNRTELHLLLFVTGNNNNWTTLMKTIMYHSEFHSLKQRLPCAVYNTEYKSVLLTRLPQHLKQKVPEGILESDVKYYYLLYKLTLNSRIHEKQESVVFCRVLALHSWYCFVV